MDIIPTGAGLADENIHPFFPGIIEIRQAILNSERAGILTDSNVAVHCLPVFHRLIPESRNLQIFEIPAGEKSKNLASVELIFDFLSQNNFDRHSLLFCLGGGMITDLGGFAASIYKRGIPCFYVPTSLMAMVDAAWGGKTGIDFKGIKNMLGTFSFSTPVFLHPAFLKSLPERRMREALAEMIKHELISGKSELLSHRILECTSEEETSHIIRQHVEMKMQWVRSDPTEKNNRKCLNLGHTLGHALEGFYLNQNVETFHGECVAAGLIFSLLLSAEQCSFPRDLALRHCATISRFCKPHFPDLPQWKQLVELIRHDKKNQKQNTQWVLLNHQLRAVINVSVEERSLRELYESDQFREFLQ